MKTILVVDDSRFQRTANRRLLEKAGYKVLSAVDGHEALQLASSSTPDLILLDMLLPKMTGPDVLKALKSDPTTAGIPVIAFSGLAQKNETRLMRDGASAYYEKSKTVRDDGTELLRLIRSILNPKSAVE